MTDLVCKHGYLARSCEICNLERALREAEEACIRSAAHNAFVYGKDIPSTIEAARIALIKRLETAEAMIQEARDYIVEASGGNIGGGENPVAFLIASHMSLRERLKKLVGQ